MEMKKLPELCNITTGKLDANAAVENGMYPYFTCGEIPSRIDEYAFDTDAILLAGNNAQGNFHVSRYNGKFNAYQRTYVLTAKENCNLDYIYYSLKLALIQLKNRSQGSQTKFLTMPILNDISINTSLNQLKIATVLSTLDNKIALNHRINAKLEAMAKRLYDYWFVQFDYPDKNGKPYKTSGGKMVWNEVLKRKIPEGWEVKSINDISVSYRGVGYTAKDEKTEKDKNIILILRGNNISNNHIIYNGNTVYVDKSFVLKEQEIKKFDIIITMSSGSKEHVGKSAMFLFDSAHSYGAFCNKITPNKECQYFLENYLHSESFIKYIRHSCSGTGINNLTNEHFDNAKFSFPTESNLQLFNKKMKSIYDERAVVEKEIQKLTNLRGRLLPLLMNGQVVTN